MAKIIKVPEGIYYQLMTVKWGRITKAVMPHYYILWAFGFASSIAIDVLDITHSSKVVIHWLGLAMIISYSLAVPFLVTLLLSFQRRLHWLNKSIAFQGKVIEEAKRHLDEEKQKK